MNCLSSEVVSFVVELISFRTSYEYVAIRRVVRCLGNTTDVSKWFLSFSLFNLRFLTAQRLFVV
jgi:hypothetical protein